MIYFLQALEGGPVKIGTTDDLDVRRKALEFHYGKRFAILATMEGGQEQERALHERFAHLRLGRTEQFRPHAELMAFIGRPLLVDANPDAVEAMSARHLPTPVRISDEAIVPAGYNPEHAAVKIDRTLAAKAQMIATDRGIPLAEYLSELIRAPIERDFMKTVREMEDAP